MSVVQTNVAKIPTDPAERKKVMDALMEISASMTRMEAERDLIKSILERMEDEFEIPKKPGRKLAKIYHKQNFSEVKEEQEELVVEESSGWCMKHSTTIIWRNGRDRKSKWHLVVMRRFHFFRRKTR